MVVTVLWVSDTIDIESTFIEAYSQAHNRCRDSYFARRGLWDGVEHLHEMASGITRFARVAQQDFEFSWLTYQELFERLNTVVEPHPGYMSYLEDRYFNPR